MTQCTFQVCVAAQVRKADKDSFEHSAWIKNRQQVESHLFQKQRQQSPRLRVDYSLGSLHAHVCQLNTTDTRLSNRLLSVLLTILLHFKRPYR